MSRLGEPAYSIRRYHVDLFLQKHLDLLTAFSLILDVGGHKNSKRGINFNLQHSDQRRIYINITADKGTDIVTDARLMPFDNNCFEAIICCEVLEHIYDQEKAVREIFRVLKPGGSVFLTVPMIYPIHGDPDDFNRHTDHYWYQKLTEIGFKETSIEKQGGYWSVLFDIIRMGLVSGSRSEHKWTSRVANYILNIYSRWLKCLPKWEEKSRLAINKNFTTGYGIVAKK